jgi:membrane protein required for colicin V production
LTEIASLVPFLSEIVTLIAGPLISPGPFATLCTGTTETMCAVTPSPNGAGVFIGTLIVVSIVTVRISDMILDSRIGALDRTLGFLFGLARGLLIVVVAFLFFSWLVPDKQRPDWVTGAKSRVVLQGTGDWLMALLPDDPENTILKRFKKNKPDDEQTDTDQAAPPSGDGYSKPARDSLKKLIEKPAGR